MKHLFFVVILSTLFILPGKITAQNSIYVDNGLSITRMVVQQETQQGWSQAGTYTNGRRYRLLVSVFNNNPTGSPYSVGGFGKTGVKITNIHIYCFIRNASFSSKNEPYSMTIALENCSAYLDPQNTNHNRSPVDVYLAPFTWNGPSGTEVHKWPVQFQTYHKEEIDIQKAPMASLLPQRRWFTPVTPTRNR